MKTSFPLYLTSKMSRFLKINSFIRPALVLRYRVGNNAVNRFRFISIDARKKEIKDKTIETLKTMQLLANFDFANIDMNSRFNEDLKLDSLDKVEALVLLEEQFELEFPDEMSQSIKTVGEAVDFLYDEEVKQDNK